MSKQITSNGSVALLAFSDLHTSDVGTVQTHVTIVAVALAVVIAAHHVTLAFFCPDVRV